MTKAKEVIARYVERTPEEHAAFVAAGEKRYAHLREQRRDWLADTAHRRDNQN